MMIHCQCITEKDASGKYVNSEMYDKDLTLPQLQSYNIGLPRPVTLDAILFPHQRIIGEIRMPSLDEAVTTMYRYSSSLVYWQFEINTNPINPKLNDYKVITIKLVDYSQSHHMVGRVEVQAFDSRAYV